MIRVLLFGLALVVAVVMMLVGLRARGFPVPVALRLGALSAGFVVSVKMVLGSYLVMQGDGVQGDGVAMIDVVGFYGSVGLVLFFGVSTFSLWRRGASKSSSPV